MISIMLSKYSYQLNGVAKALNLTEEKKTAIDD